MRTLEHTQTSFDNTYVDADVIIVFTAATSLNSRSNVHQEQIQPHVNILKEKQPLAYSPKDKEDRLLHREDHLTNAPQTDCTGEGGDGGGGGEFQQQVHRTSSGSGSGSTSSRPKQPGAGPINLIEEPLFRAPPICVEPYQQQHRPLSPPPRLPPLRSRSRSPPLTLPLPRALITSPPLRPTAEAVAEATAARIGSGSGSGSQQVLMSPRASRWLLGGVNAGHRDDRQPSKTFGDENSDNGDRKGSRATAVVDADVHGGGGREDDFVRRGTMGGPTSTKSSTKARPASFISPPFSGSLQDGKVGREGEGEEEICEEEEFWLPAAGDDGSVESPPPPRMPAAWGRRDMDVVGHDDGRAEEEEEEEEEDQEAMVVLDEYESDFEAEDDYSYP